MLALTPKAQEKLHAVLDSNGLPNASVRIAAVLGPHGCVHGWKLALEDAPAPQDTVVQAGGVRLLVEPDLAEALEGALIDYREDGLGIGFTIEAPNTPPPMHQHGGGCHH
ncbi:MAG: iron-sulfur cluster assembly accessory protein [Chloroflexi bacterium]|nr:iron-sulfur cluster assembly accessory protein [Chloroflexota bacterium]